MYYKYWKYQGEKYIKNFCLKIYIVDYIFKEVLYFRSKGKLWATIWYYCGLEEKLPLSVRYTLSNYLYVD